MVALAKKQRSTLIPRWTSAISDHVIGVAWSPDTTMVAAASISGPITLFDGATGAIRHQFAGHGFGTTAIAWHPTEALLASAGQDGTIRLWNTTSGDQYAEMAGGSAWVEAIAWSPDGVYLASAAGKKLRFWNPDGTLVQACDDHAATISHLGWKPLPQRGAYTPMLATASYGGIRLWKPQRVDAAREFVWKGSSLVLQWSPDGSYIATGDQDSTVHFWITKTGRDLHMYGYPTKVKELAWDCTSRYLATGGSAHIVIWDCSGRGPENTTPMTLKGHDALLTALQYQPRGPLLLSGGADARLMLWQPNASRRPLVTIDCPNPVASLAWSPDTTHVVVGGDDGSVMLLAHRS